MSNVAHATGESAAPAPELSVSSFTVKTQEQCVNDLINYLASIRGAKK